MPHERYTREGGRRPVIDPRDVYEIVANQGARRLRACILSIIDGDVVEAAVKQCERTLKTRAEVTPEALQSMLTMFAEYGVAREAIEKRVQRRLEAISPAQLVQLGKVYNSIKDGMSSPGDWFELQPAQAPPQGPEGASEGEPPRTRTAAVKDALKARGRPKAQAQAEPPPATRGKAAPAPTDSELLQDVIDIAGRAKTDEDVALAADLARSLVNTDSIAAAEAIEEARKRIAAGGAGA